MTHRHDMILETSHQMLISVAMAYVPHLIGVKDFFPFYVKKTLR